MLPVYRLPLSVLSADRLPLQKWDFIRLFYGLVNNSCSGNT
jgi:hypothetical protein